MNKSPIVKARHLWKTTVKNGKEVPVEKEFTEKAWKALNFTHHDGKEVAKQGYVSIANVATPPEAKKVAAPKEG